MSTSNLTSIPMEARSLLRQARCPECGKPGYGSDTGSCAWCDQRDKVCQAILDMPGDETQPVASNLVDKLRDPAGGIFTAHELCRQAADEIERQEPQMSAMRCYVCQSAGDKIASDCREVYLEDDGHKTVYVGPTCFKKVERAGDAGLVSGKGRGPRVFFTFDQAARHAQRSTVEPPAHRDAPLWAGDGPAAPCTPEKATDER